MSIFQISALIIVICALVVIGGVAAFQKTAVYKFSAEPGQPSHYGLSSFQEFTVATEHGHNLRVWASKPRQGMPVIISFYGNFSQLGTSVQRLKPLSDLGFGVAVMEYRGSDKGASPAGELAFAHDAVSLYDQLDTVMGFHVEPENRVIHGFSLGTSPATYLASNRDAAALILESGFDRLCRFQQRRLKGLPACKLMWAERHDVVDLIRSVDMPLLIAHGARDQAIPLPWSEALFNAAKSPKTFKHYEDGGHGDLLGKGLAQDIKTFLAPDLN